ncbi:hypothetical protein SAMD00023353_4200400 [Rosellinia necatrix]|uniref:Uncharacterized protein n=1 Tax=Rosellinia necatrix TaxID=77044 RepID=A0A1W2TP76_ROSNE|nr:hypothetical protein SAMD00023353_4200400 [Rosellinia necatrix]
MSKRSERQGLLRVLKQTERKTLQQLYGPVAENPVISLKGDLTSSRLQSFMKKLAQTSKDQQARIQAGAVEEVEQEGEVEAQVEQVRQRPVEWIIWSPTTEIVPVVIPEDAEYFMEFLRNWQRAPRTHPIAYAAPVTKTMVHFNRLEFYSYPDLPTGQTIPECIRIELGTLAGRLYVDQDEWKAVAEYVRGAVNDPDKIAAEPAAFLLKWLSIRRMFAFG